MNSETISFPMIGKAADVAAILRKSKKTIQNMVTRERFKKGVYIGDGRFNLSRLKEFIEQGSYLRTAERV